MKPPRSMREALRQELADWRLWLARALVVAAAVVAGLTVVGFTWLAETASSYFTALRLQAWWAPLLAAPAAAAAVVWCTRRFAPGAAGSGIPQVMATLEKEVGDAERGLFVSLRLSVAKIRMRCWKPCGLKRLWPVPFAGSFASSPTSRIGMDGRRRRSIGSASTSSLSAYEPRG